MSITNKKSINDVDLTDKRVLMRVDFNVVSAVTGKVEDKLRLENAVPTIKLALEKKAKVITLLSHCGRPDGKVDEKYSLKPVIPVLEELLGSKVQFASCCIGDEIESMIASASPGTIILAENLRFHAEEEGKGATEEQIALFRSKLSKLGDILVNDAFGCAHRAHSSMVGISLPRVSGLLLKKELDYFGRILQTPDRPFLAILGGSKIKDKIQVIYSLLDKVDMVLIGGGMAYTFCKVIYGMNIGMSLFDKVGAEIVPDIMKKAEEKGVKIYLPLDFACGDAFKPDCNMKIFERENGIEEGWEGLDIGPKSREQAKEVISKAKLVCWNGPQGVFEFDRFAVGSVTVLDALCDATANGCCTVVGGGDSGALCQKFDRVAKMSHVSTGGGASLELLEGKQLPGVLALDSK